jgi:hypothetical protein
MCGDPPDADPPAEEPGVRADADRIDACSVASSTSASAGSPATTLALAGTVRAAIALALWSTASALGSTSASSRGRLVSIT